MDIVWAADLTPPLVPPGPPPPLISALDANGNLLINGVPFLLIEAAGASYNDWVLGGYTEAQADAMLQIMVNAGYNCLQAQVHRVYPYSNPVYAGQTNFQVIGAKFPSLRFNGEDGVASQNYPAVAAFLGQYKNNPQIIMWCWGSEYADLTAVNNQKYIRAADPSRQITCTQILDGVWIGYGGSRATYPFTVYYTGNENPIGTLNVFDELVNADGLSIFLYEFAQSSGVANLWKYLLFYDRRIRALTTPSPSSAPGGTDGGVGHMSGTFQFLYTWVTRTTAGPDAIESFASPISAPITVTNGKVALSGIANGPAGVTGKNLYVKKVGGSPLSPNGRYPTSGFLLIDYLQDNTTTTDLVDLDHVSVTGTVSSGSAIVTGVSDTSQLVPGRWVQSPNRIPVSNNPYIQYASTIASVDSSSQITLSQAALGSAAITLDFPFTTPPGYPPPAKGALDWMGGISTTFVAVEGLGYTGIDSDLVSPRTLDTCRRNYFLQAALNCRAFDTLTVWNQRGSNGNNDPVLGALSQNSTISLSSASSSDTGANAFCEFEGVLADGVTVNREKVQLNGTSAVATSQTYSKTKWVGAASGVVGPVNVTQSVGGANLIVRNPVQQTGNPALVLTRGNGIFAPATDGLPYGFYDAFLNTGTALSQVNSLRDVILAPGIWTRISAVTPIFVPYDEATSGHQSKGIYAAKKSYGGFLWVIAVNVDQVQFQNVIPLCHGDLTPGSADIINITGPGMPTPTNGWPRGSPVSGPGIPLGATIANIVSGTRITLSANVTRAPALPGAPFFVALENTISNGSPPYMANSTVDVGQTIMTCVRVAGESGSPTFSGTQITGEQFLPMAVHVYKIS